MSAPGGQKDDSRAGMLEVRIITSEKQVSMMFLRRDLGDALSWVPFMRHIERMMRELNQ